MDTWRILQIIRLFPLFIGISQDFAPRYFQRSSLEKTRATTDPALACNATHGLNDTILVAPNHESRAHFFRCEKFYVRSLTAHGLAWLPIGRKGGEIWMCGSTQKRLSCLRNELACIPRGDRHEPMHPGLLQRGEGVPDNRKALADGIFPTYWPHIPDLPLAT